MGALTPLRFGPSVLSSHCSQVLIFSPINFSRVIKTLFKAEPSKCWQTSTLSSERLGERASAISLVRQTWVIAHFYY